MVCKRLKKGDCVVIDKCCNKKYALKMGLKPCPISKKKVKMKKRKMMKKVKTKAKSKKKKRR